MKNLLILLLVSATTLMAEKSQVTVFLKKGGNISGKLKAISKDKITVTQKDKDKDYPLKDVSCLQFPHNWSTENNFKFDNIMSCDVETNEGFVYKKAQITGMNKKMIFLKYKTSKVGLKHTLIKSIGNVRHKVSNIKKGNSVIFFVNNDSLEGQLVDIKDNVIIMKTQYGNMKFPISRVASFYVTPNN